MDFSSYLFFLREKEKEFLGENRLSNAKMMAIARQSVGKNKAGDLLWLLQRMQEIEQPSKGGKRHKISGTPLPPESHHQHYS